jgi:hypothetical protein
VRSPNSPWTALALAAACVAAAFYLFWPGTPVAPPTGTGPDRPDEGVQVEPPEPVAAPVEGRGDVDVVTAVRGQASRDGRTELVLTVVYARGTEQRPAPFLQIVLTDEAGRGAQATRTNAAGGATFELPEASPERVAVKSAGGGRATLPVRRGERTTATLVLPVRLEVSGRVLDASGRGVADADIVRQGFGSDDEPAPVGRSAADGRYAIAVALGGHFAAEHPDYAPSKAIWMRPEENDVPQALDFTLLGRAAALHGTVLAHTGQPVAGASLTCTATTSSPKRRAVSDADGAFRLDNLVPGPNRLVVTAPGHGAVEVTTIAEPGGRAVDVRLAPACRIVGRATDAVGEPAAGARVEIQRFGRTFGTTTGADGTFTLDDLAPGPVEATARRNGTPRAARAETALVLTPGIDARWDVQFGADARPGLLGRLLLSAGRAHGGWRVVIRRGTERITQAQTDGEGCFDVAIDVATAGADSVDALLYAPDHEPTATGFADHLAEGLPVAAEQRVLIPVPASPQHALRGSVRAENGVPLPATIGVWHQQRREFVEVRADGDGQFVVPRVPKGTVDVVVTHAGWPGVHRRDLTMTAFQDLVLSPIVLTAGGAVFGDVRTPNGPPAEVTISITTNRERFVADYVDGTYRFPALPPGGHRLQVQAPGVAATTFEILVQAGVDVRHDIVLQPGITRRVRVTAPTASDATVQLRLRQRSNDDQPGDLTWAASAPLAANGGAAAAEFVVCLPPGNYEAFATTRGGLSTQTTLVFVHDGEPAEMTLRRP